MNLLIETTRSIIKEGIVNVTGEELDENKIELLNLNINLYLRKTERHHTWTLFKLQKFVH